MKRKRTAIILLLLVAALLTGLFLAWWYVSELPESLPIPPEDKAAVPKGEQDVERALDEAIGDLPVLQRTDGARVVMRLPAGADFSGPSPDGTKIAATVFGQRKEDERVSPASVWVYDTVTKKGKRLPVMDQQNLYPTWRPDSEAVIYVSGHRRLGVVTSRLFEYQLSWSEPRLLLKVSSRPLQRLRLASIHDPAVSSDGRVIVFAAISKWPKMRPGVDTWDDDLWCLDRTSGNVTRLRESPDREAMPAIAPDCKRVAFVVMDRKTKYRTSKLWTCYLKDGEGLQPMPGSEGACWPTWSPDGSKIAFSRNGRVYIIGSKGGKAIQLTDRNAFMPQWSADGKTIYFGSHAVIRSRSCWWLMQIDVPPG